MALVSIVDTDRQWFKSKQGVALSETPRAVSFCAHAIHHDAIFHIPDALEDERFVDNPLVSGPPHLRFYAGAPLRISSGEKVGTLCILDDKPRVFSEDDLSVLRDLADTVETEIEKTLFNDAHKILQSQDKYLKTLLEIIFDGVIVIDLKGNIRSVNTAVERLFGYTVILPKNN